MVEETDGELYRWNSALTCAVSDHCGRRFGCLRRWDDDARKLIEHGVARGGEYVERIFDVCERMCELHRGDVVRYLVGNGNLSGLGTFLKAYQMPLRAYPSYARKEDALRFLTEGLEPHTDLDTYHFKRRGTLGPPPEAQVLANYLMVPTAVAEEVMEGIEDELVFFDQRSDDEVDPVSAPSAPSVYISKLSDVNMRHVEYMHAANQIVLKGNDVNRPSLKTSRLHPLVLSVTRSASPDLHKANSMVFIYQCGDARVRFSKGGFALLNKDLSVIALFELTDKPSEVGCVLGFGAPKNLGKAKTSRLLEELDPWSKWMGSGCKTDHYAFVPPLFGLYSLGTSSKVVSGDSLSMGGLLFATRNPGSSDILPDVTDVTYWPIKEVSHSLSQYVNKHENFPTSLGAIFLERRVLDDEWHSAEAHEGNILSVFRKTGQVDASMTKMFEVTLDKDQKHRGLIPEEASHFAFLYNHKGLQLPRGAFVYFKDADSGKKVVGLNAVQFRPRAFGLRFAQPRTMTKTHCEKFAGQWTRVTAEVLLSQGAKEYVFIGPGTYDEGDEVFEYGDFGGFAYKLAQARDGGGVYFRIESTGEVLNRSCLYDEMDVALLDSNDPNPLGKLIRSAHAFHDAHKTASFPSAVRSLVRQVEQAVFHAKEAPVTIAKVNVPNVTHPVVLHALAYTSRQEVFSRTSSKAIAGAAFHRHSAKMAVDLMLEVILMVFITLLSHKARESENQTFLDQDGMFLLVATLLLWLKLALDEVAECAGLLSYGWARFFLNTRRLFTFVLLLTLAVAVVWQLASAHVVQAARPLLAASGALQWLKVMYACRAFQVAQLGKRILPIVMALRDVGDFIIFASFVFCAAAHYSFALTDSSVGMDRILLSTYRFGFLADFDVDQDVLFTDGSSADFKLMFYVAFLLVSFMVSLSLTNIFIRIMGSAFDQHTGNVDQLFHRARVEIALQYELKVEGISLFWSCIRPLALALWFPFWSCIRRCLASLRQSKAQDSDKTKLQQGSVDGQAGSLSPEGPFLDVVPHSSSRKVEDTWLWLCKREVEEVDEESTLRYALHALTQKIDAKIPAIDEKLNHVTQASVVMYDMLKAMLEFQGVVKQNQEHTEDGGATLDKGKEAPEPSHERRKSRKKDRRSLGDWASDVAGDSADFRKRPALLS